MLRMRTAGWARGWCLGCCFLLPLSLSLAAAKQLLRYRLAEEGPADVRIGNVASDLGIVTGSGEVTFSLESGSEYLKIDNLTGELSTSERRIDREKLPQCQMIFDENECFLDFEVSVIGPSQSWVDLFEGRVIVLDINDNTPTFPSPVLTLTVEENRPVGTLYLLPTATDRDFGRNGIERYELLQEPGGGGGEGRRAGSADSAPYPGGGGNGASSGSGQGNSKRRLDPPESGGGTNPGGRSSVFELQVADTPDGEKQPQLIVKGALDREQRDSYELTLRVRDGGDPPRSSQAILRVLITDVNDNSPRFEKSVYEADLAENSAPGTPILQLRAADMDVGVNGQIEYVFGAATESVRRLLRLDETSGWLSVLHRIDREEVNQLRFTVMARDRGQPPKTDKATVVLNIKDENDNVPSIEIRKIGRIPLKDGVANVVEDVLVDTPIALVQVSDRDQGENGVVTCTVVGDVPFQLKPASDTEGDQNKKKYFLHTSAPLDYETTPEFNVVIVAVDSGSPSLSSNNSLVVKVGDTNDNPPVFEHSVVEVYFFENNIPGDRVATVKATDADSGKNAEIAYSLDSSVMGVFTIDPNSGDILVNTVLDREQNDRYEFKVNAKDKGIPVLQGSTSVIVQVADKNDNDPKFMQDVFTFYVKENLQPNSPVGMVTVMDADKGKNAEMRLYIEENSNIFSIENDTGTIYSTMSFDREHQTTYTFRVKAVDGGDPPRSATATVSLFVMDENDNAPTVSLPRNISYTLLPPSSNVRTVVATVLATDSDDGINADLNYSIVGGNPFKLFEIDSTSGVVSLVGKLTQKHYGLHRLVVQVNDSGQPSQSTTTLVHVFVNESVSNATVIDSQIVRSLHTPLTQDIAGDPSYEISKQRLSIVIGVVAGIMTVILIILIVVMARYCRSKNKNGYEAGKKDHEDFFTPQQHDKSKKPKKDKRNKKSKQPLYSSIVTVEASKPNGQRYDSVNEKLSDSPSMGRYRSVNGGPGSPDLARHYKSSSPLPTVQLHPQSPTAGKKHQAVQDLPPANTFVGAGDNISIGSDHCSEYSCQTNNKYSKQPFRRVTFSVVSQPQDPHQGSLQSCYDSGLEESETPSSKSSSGPRLGALPLPEDNYERTTPDGSVGEAEHMENDSRPLPDVALTGKCTRECDEYGHSDSCWMPVRTSPERKKSQPKLSTFMPVDERGSQEKLANGEAAIMGDRNRNLLNKKLTSSYETFSTPSFGKNEEVNPEDIPLTKTGEYKPSPVNTLTRREVYL
ncbi:PREDICTED: protocadherin-7-like isoform X1 [Chrysochloris asiatica]|uniref:Protocadherin-7-like isoform X1 n=1 Tax=Chrysochloris asiatica TaxID=185453 RepID=A0A9B0U5T9_CHRAS|nr:PREDICTED: protocadherin-7-like isoform X1 [Chrysochloris asiatica]